MEQDENHEPNWCEKVSSNCHFLLPGWTRGILYTYTLWQKLQRLFHVFAVYRDLSDVKKTCVHTTKTECDVTKLLKNVRDTYVARIYSEVPYSDQSGTPPYAISSPFRPYSQSEYEQLRFLHSMQFYIQILRLTKSALLRYMRWEHIGRHFSWWLQFGISFLSPKIHTMQGMFLFELNTAVEVASLIGPAVCRGVLIWKMAWKKSCTYGMPLATVSVELAPSIAAFNCFFKIRILNGGSTDLVI